MYQFRASMLVNENNSGFPLIFFCLEVPPDFQASIIDAFSNLGQLYFQNCSAMSEVTTTIRGLHFFELKSKVKYKLVFYI